MRQVLLSVLILVVGTAVSLPAVFADGSLDSLVDIATKARTQVRFQLENSQGVSDDLKALFGQGNQETELLISSVKEGDVVEAKQHFLAAMRIFKQISVGLSEPQQSAALKTTPAPQVTQTTITNYKNDIDRTEKYVGMLKDLVIKNNFTVDFSKTYTLIQNARTSLAANDIQSIERINVDLKAALADIQNAIKDQTVQRQNDRAKSFANSYIAKIDAMLAQATQLGLSEDDIARLNKVKQEISSTTDPNLLIVKIKRYSINFNTSKQIIIQLRNQTSADTAAKLLTTLDSTIKEIENYVQSKQNVATQQTETPESKPAKPAGEQKPAAELKQERKQKETTKSQKNPEEIAKLEARLANIEPYVDDNIKSKFETAKLLLAKLKNQETTNSADYLRSARILDLQIDSLEQYVKSLQDGQAKNNSNNSGDGSNQEIKTKQPNREKQK
jgi:hypothetical protein